MKIEVEITEGDLRELSAAHARSNLERKRLWLAAIEQCHLILAPFLDEISTKRARDEKRRREEDVAGP